MSLSITPQNMPSKQPLTNKKQSNPSFNGIVEYTNYLAKDGIPKTDEDLRAKVVEGLPKLYRMDHEDALATYQEIEKSNYKNQNGGGFKTFLTSIISEMKKEGKKEELSKFLSDMQSIVSKNNS